MEQNIKNIINLSKFLNKNFINIDSIVKFNIVLIKALEYDKNIKQSINTLFIGVNKDLKNLALIQSKKHKFDNMIYKPKNVIYAIVESLNADILDSNRDIEMDEDFFILYCNAVKMIL